MVCRKDSISALLFWTEKGVDENEMDDRCSGNPWFSGGTCPLLLYPCRGAGGSDAGGAGAERQAGCKRGKRIGNSLPRTSRKTACTAISGTKAKDAVRRMPAIIFFQMERCPGKRMGIAGAARMDGTLPASVTACRKSYWNCAKETLEIGKEGDRFAGGSQPKGRGAVHQRREDFSQDIEKCHDEISPGDGAAEDAKGTAGSRGTVRWDCLSGED